MKSRYLLFLLFSFLASCNAKQEPQANYSNASSVEESKSIDSSAALDNTNTQVSEVDSTQSRTFLSLFKSISPKGYHAFSPEFSDGLKVLDRQFQGVPIDAKKFQGLLKEDAVPYLGSILQGYGGIFAIGKFDINKQYTGLVVRQHSQYSDTQIALLLWDKQRNQIGKGLELADMFGDAGWFFDRESWITEFVPNETLVIVTRTKDFEPNENFTSGTVTDSMSVSRFSGGKFITTNAPSQDTTKFKLKRWKL
ncbi:MAG: hypothetical protein ACO1OQ_11560 [Rufibacter sp.]